MIRQIASRIAAIVATAMIALISTHVDMTAELAQAIRDFSEVGVWILLTIGYAVIHPTIERFFPGKDAGAEDE